MGFINRFYEINMYNSNIFCLDLQFHKIETKNQEACLNLPTDIIATENRNTPKCDRESRIYLMSYWYQHRKCLAGQGCFPPHRKMLTSKQEFLIHEICSFQEECTNLTLLMSQDLDSRANSMCINYQCISK